MSHPTAIHILARISSVHRSLRFVYSFHMFKGSWTYSSGNSHSVWLGWCRRSTTTRKPQVDIWARATQQQLPKEIGNRRRIETEEDSSSWSWFFTAAALLHTTCFHLLVQVTYFYGYGIWMVKILNFFVEEDVSSAWLGLLLVQD